MNKFNMKFNKVSIFDFDHTLFYTHDHIAGRKEWFHKTGNFWPHQSWWDQPDSINFKILDIKPYQHVIANLKEAFKEKETYTILLSGRPVGSSGKVKKAIQKLLDHHKIDKFDLILLNQMDHLDLDFKLQRLTQLRKKFKCDDWEFFDDKYSYASTFITWGRENVGTSFKYHLV